MDKLSHCSHGTCSESKLLVRWIRGGEIHSLLIATFCELPFDGGVVGDRSGLAQHGHEECSVTRRDEFEWREPHEAVCLGNRVQDASDSG